MSAPLEESGGAATRHSYPAAALIGDYLRAAVGVVPAVAVFSSTPVNPIAAAVVGGIGAIFTLFGLRTALRHGTSLEMTETELRSHGARQRTIAWAKLDRLKLAYYSTRRDRKSGWMQLEIGAGAARVRLDSRIEGFDRLLHRAAKAALARRLALNDTTLANLNALGIDMPDFGEQP